MKFSKEVTRSFERKYHVDTHLSIEFCRILRHFPRFFYLFLSFSPPKSYFPRKHYILWHSSQYFLKFFLPQTWHTSEICTWLFYGYRCTLVLSTAILKLKDSYFSRECILWLWRKCETIFREPVYNIFFNIS